MPSKEKLAQVLWAFQVLQDQFQLQAALLLGVFNCAITGEKIKKSFLQCFLQHNFLLQLEKHSRDLHKHTSGISLVAASKYI